MYPSPASTYTVHTTLLSLSNPESDPVSLVVDYLLRFILTVTCGVLSGT